MNLPPGTQAKLGADHPEGTRHQAKLELAMELLGNGIPEVAVEATFSEKFPDAHPREIRDSTPWAIGHNPEPPCRGNSDDFRSPPRFPTKPAAKPKKNQAARTV